MLRKEYENAKHEYETEDGTSLRAVCKSTKESFHDEFNWKMQKIPGARTRWSRQGWVTLELCCTAGSKLYRGLVFVEKTTALWGGMKDGKQIHALYFAQIKCAMAVPFHNCLRLDNSMFSNQRLYRGPIFVMPNTITFDSASDLALVVGQGAAQRQCLVSKKVASDVFKDLLIEADGEAEQTRLALPHDDTDAAELMLKIIHYRFKDIPKATLDLSKLRQVAKLVDKYDLISVAVPYVAYWTKNIGKVAMLDDELLAHLHISWVFGLKLEFEQVARLVLLKAHNHTKTSACKRLRVSRWKSCQEVPKIRENIARLREDVIQRIVDACNYQTSCALTKNVCLEDTEKEACTAMMLGSLIKGLKPLGLWPIPTASIVKHSIEELFLRVKKVKIHEHRGMEGSHQRCAEMFSLKWKMDKQMADLPSPVDVYHTKLVESRADKLCGLGSVLD